MFAELVRRHQGGIIGFCVSMLSHREVAEDAAQEVFIKAFKSLEAFRGESSFSTWLYRIAFNHCCTLKKSFARRRMESMEGLSYYVREKATGRWDMDNRGTPELDALGGAMDKLPESYRALIALRLQGRSYREMAAIAGISVEAVRARLRRARLMLRRDLRRFFPGAIMDSNGA